MHDAFTFSGCADHDNKGPIVDHHVLGRAMRREDAHGNHR